MTTAALTRGTVRTPVLFLLAVAAVPFMDWPYMLGFSSYVRPLALLPIALGLIAMAGHMLTTGTARVRVSGPFACFALFAACALVATPIAILVDPGAETVKGTTVYARALRELFGLLVGLGCFAFFTQNVRSTRDIRAAVRTLYLVFPLTVLAVLIQAGWLYFGSDALFVVDRSVLGLVQAHPAVAKASGLSPEASMLADQLLSTVLPFAFAALLMRHSLFRMRPLGLRVEAWVAAGSMLALVFSRSRIGMIGFLFLVGLAAAYALLRRRAVRRRQIAALLAVPLLALALLASSPDARERLVEVASSIAGIAASTDAGIWSNVTRLGAQVTGLRMFLDHPLGVGTGGYAFHFAEYVPAWAVASPEIQIYLDMDTPATRYICPEDCSRIIAEPMGLPARLLSETGLPGLVLIAAMFSALFLRSWRSYRHAADAETRCLSLGCLLSLSVITLLSFNIASYIWVHWYLVFAMAAALPGTRRGAPVRLPAGWAGHPIPLAGARG